VLTVSPTRDTNSDEGKHEQNDGKDAGMIKASHNSPSREIGILGPFAILDGFIQQNTWRVNLPL
jgi:hypothetical protein